MKKITPTDILTFWFAPDTNGRTPEQHKKNWFMGGETFDDLIRTHFPDAVSTALSGAFGKWQESPEGTLALIIILDQFTRNLHRRTPQAFSGDPQALALTHKAIQKGWHTDLLPEHQTFLYMPLMHSEKLSDQQLCIDVFTEAAEGTDNINDKNYLKSSIPHAIDHLKLIQRFGRFPHRNITLARENTEKETAHLKDGGKTFGQ